LVRERPPPLFLQRLRRTKEEKQFDKFIEMMKQLHINIPLIEVIPQMPNDSKFMKDVLTKRRRIGEFETNVN
jgi:molybdenum cofactor biosynthesis enzyme MoaA